MSQDFTTKFKKREVNYGIHNDPEIHDGEGKDNGQITAKVWQVFSPSGPIIRQMVDLHIQCSSWTKEQNLTELTPRQAKLLAQAILELLEEN